MLAVGGREEGKEDEENAGCDAIGAGPSGFGTSGRALGDSLLEHGGAGPRGMVLEGGAADLGGGTKASEEGNQDPGPGGARPRLEARDCCV